MKTVAADMSDLFAVGESGLMGLVVDPGFSQNRELYTCQGYSGPEGQDVRVIKWTVDAGYTRATRSKVLVKGIQNTGSTQRVPAAVRSDGALVRGHGRRGDWHHATRLG